MRSIFYEMSPVEDDTSAGPPSRKVETCRQKYSAFIKPALCDILNSSSASPLSGLIFFRAGGIELRETRRQSSGAAVNALGVFPFRGIIQFIPRRLITELDPVTAVAPAISSAFIAGNISHVFQASYLFSYNR